MAYAFKNGESTEPLQKAQERLAIHELIRVGVGRQEDLRLLQNVALQAACLPGTSVAQLLREAALREEWRAGREAALLSSLRSLTLRSLLGGGPDGCLSAVDGQLLAEQVAALSEVQQQLLQRKRHRAAARLPPGRQPAASPPQIALRDARHSAASSSSTGSYGSSGAAGDAPSPGETGYDGFRFRSRQRLPGSGVAGTTAAAAAIYGASAGGAVVGSPARALRSKSSHSIGGAAAGRGERRHTGSAGGIGGGGPAAFPSALNGKTATATLPSGRPSRPRPGSAPHGTCTATAEGDRSRVAAAVAAAAASGSGALPPPPSLPQQQQQPHSSGFRNLLRLQQLLMQGLREHAAQEGEGGALEALEAHTAEGRALFADCLAEALEAAGLAPSEGSTAGWLQQGHGGTGIRQCASPSRRGVAVAWDRLLRLGQLGLTRADVARLDEIQRRQAARVIQRQVRRWLRRRHHAARVAHARARAEAMHRRLRERAAVVIQAWVRGHLARRRAAALAAAAAQQATVQRQVHSARVRAATRIQRAWRAHVRMVRYRAVLAAAAAAWRRREYERQQQQWEMGGEEVEGTPAGYDAGRGDVLRPAGGSGGVSPLPFERAVMVIQAHIRGWLVRRSTDLWWVRAAASLRQRRGAVRCWQQHQRFMAASYDLQAQLLGAMLREAQVVAALHADVARQQAELSAAFQTWLLGQQRVALSQPLPRGWVPHPHPQQPERTCFLNTRTGELHALHPAVAELARHAREQHDAATEDLQRRLAGLPQYTTRLHAATQQQAGLALAAIALHYQAAAAGGPGRGPGAAGKAGAEKAVAAGSAGTTGAGRPQGAAATEQLL